MESQYDYIAPHIFKFGEIWSNPPWYNSTNSKLNLYDTSRSTLGFSNIFKRTHKQAYEILPAHSRWLTLSITPMTEMKLTSIPIAWCEQKISAL